MKIQILLRDQGDATTPWFFIKKYTCLYKQIFPYSWWLFKYLSLQILILHFYTGLNCSLLLLLLHVSHQIKLYFKNFLQVCTFLSQTPVTFALCESILPPWYLYWFFFFWSGGIIVSLFGTEIQMNDSKSQKLRMFLWS